MLFTYNPSPVSFQSSALSKPLATTTPNREVVHGASGHGMHVAPKRRSRLKLVTGDVPTMDRNPLVMCRFASQKQHQRAPSAQLLPVPRHPRARAGIIWRLQT